MNLRDVGLGLFSAGAALLLGNAVYAILVAADMPPVVRYSLLAMFFGLLILLASLVRERLTEVDGK